MARTELTIPTSLSGDELTARLEMFFQCHKFKRGILWGEELYKLGGLLWAPAYLKIIPGDGFLHVEAFYFNTGRRGWGSRELKIGTGFLFDPRDMQGKLRELSKFIGDGASTNFLPATATAEQADSQMPKNSFHDPFSEDFAPAWQQNAKRRNPLLTGCLIGCLIVFALPLCLLIGAFLYGVFLALFFPEPEDSIAKKWQVSTVGWKTLNEDQYSLEYPGDWNVLNQNNQYLLGSKPSDGLGAAVGIVTCRENSGLYDELTEENIMERLFSPGTEKYLILTCDIFQKGSARKKRALFALYSGKLEVEGKTSKIYYWLSENDDAIVTIWFTTNDENYEKYQPVFDTIISTLRLK